MKQRAITQVEVDSLGRLLVRPWAESDAIYEYIYREANGLRWDKEKHSFCAYASPRAGGANSCGTLPPRSTSR